MKNVFTSFIHFFLFGNIFVSLSTAALVYSTYVQTNIPIKENVHFLLLVFFSTLFIYNFQRIFYKSAESYTIESIRRKWISRHSLLIKIFCAVGALGVGILLLLKTNYLLIIYLSPLLVISILYFSFAKLRQSAWAKLITLVFVWVMVTAVVPILMYSPSPFSLSNTVHIGMQFFFMMAICIPFDIRDLQIDEDDDIVTLPHTLGERKAKQFSLLLITMHIVLIFIQYTFDNLSLQYSIALFCSAIFTTLFILLTTSKRNEYFFIAGIDGTMLVQGIAILIATYCC